MTYPTKRCPFCGGSVFTALRCIGHNHYVWRVECNRKKTCGALGPTRSTDWGADKAWDKRVKTRT